MDRESAWSTLSGVGPLLHEACGIKFSFYTKREVERLSVCKVTSSRQRDVMNRPLANGLYDARMGPTDNWDTCVTCGLEYGLCPGHFGHIDLPLPTYTHLLFPLLHQLLRCACSACHHFRAPRARLEPYAAALRLLDAGLLTDAAAVLESAAVVSGNSKLGNNQQRAAGEVAEESEGAWMSGVSAAGCALLRRPAAAGSAGVAGGCASSPHLIALRKRILAGLARALRPASNKCTRCGRASGSLKVHGGKFFVSALSQRALAANEQLGLAPVSSSRRSTRNGSVAATAAAASAVAANRTEGSDDDDDDEEEDDEEAEEVDEAAAEAMEVDEATAERGTSQVGKSLFLNPTDARERMAALWEAESQLLGQLYPSLDADSFFQEFVIVPPNRFRPPAKVGDQLFDHSQNVFLNKVLTAIETLHRIKQQKADQDAAAAGGQTAGGGNGYGPMTDQRMMDRYLSAWDEMSLGVASMVDSTAGGGKADEKDAQGVKQMLERKAGLFRSNMMGKRVNFCCRSVISPDVNLGTHEIGVPLHFATELTFPEPVTPWNVQVLRRAVVNGPHEHPGANFVQDADGAMIDLRRRSRPQRVAIAARLLADADGGGGSVAGGELGGAQLLSPSLGGGLAAMTPKKAAAAAGIPGITPGSVVPPSAGLGRSHVTGGVKKVWRHLVSGDAMLVNRQPTLHKPGIMAHSARVLRNEKVIRMHYANCNTYNADFDGDEMNLHLCQSHLARAEAYHIAATDHQYIVPTNGRPLRGLIQDHVVMGVLLTKRDTFLTKSQYMQLLFLAGVDLSRGGGTFVTMPPTILKPAPLWTGKQVISTLLRHLGAGALNCAFKAKTAGDTWARPSCAGYAGTGEPEENAVQILDGELLTGVLDKAAFGATEFGLVHSVHELLGGEPAGQLLSQLGRLLTGYEQMHGHTCGIGDVMLTPAADERRRRLHATADGCGVSAAESFGKLAPGALAAAAAAGAGGSGSGGGVARAAFRQLLAEKLTEADKGDEAGAALDSAMKQALLPLASEVGAACLPSGMAVPFPRNQFAIMTQTGAKGSQVNFSQIAVMLGQQELEGRRVPIGPSGATAPCFAPFELSARAGGYITDRFLTGVRPPEFYFHCMAGREGLVDTAVKTSRSGYLQRCLIKHLEPLQVAYDHTVRNVVDGSVVSFVAGEDGLDPTRVAFFGNQPFLAANAHALRAKWTPRHVPAASAGRLDAAAAHKRHAARLATPPEKRPILLERASPAACLGNTSLAFEESMEDFLARAAKDPASAVAAGRPAPAADVWREVVWHKYLDSLSPPGEAVGLLAAQSVGEPSTQMTLNTFHLAGTGLANVTLGIPRLREVIMVASRKPSTPLMTLSLLEAVQSAGGADAAAQEVRHRLERVTFAEVLQRVTAEERLRPEAAPAGGGAAEYSRRVRLTLHFDPAAAGVQRVELLLPLVEQLLPSLKRAMAKHAAAASKGRKAVTSRAARREAAPAAAGGGDEDGGVAGGEGGEGERRGRSGDDDGGGDGDGGGGGDDDDDDARAAARAARRSSADYDDEEDGGESGRASSPTGEEGEEGDEEEAEGAAAGSGGGALGGRSAAAAAEEASAERAFVTRLDALCRPGGSLVGAGVASDGLSGWIDCRMPARTARLQLVPLVEELAPKVVVRHTEGITSAVVLPPPKGSKAPVIQTAGVNFGALASSRAMAAVVDLNKVRSNDIYAVLCTFGVEAARATIVSEIKSVFGVYGIKVDPRHLALIGDYMTHEGGYTPLNRSGMETHVSPLLKMTFETTTHFLTQAATHGDPDPLTAPSAAIVLGKPVSCGTGAFGLRANLAASCRQ